MKKRILSLILALTMVIGLFPAVSASSAFDPGNGMFAPEDELTRGMFFYALWNYFGSPVPYSTENPFTDISEADYYYDAVLWAVENYITNGMTDTQFGPDQSVNRAQVATFLWRAFENPEPIGENPFSDVPEDSFFCEPVRWACAEGYMGPLNGENTFCPTDVCLYGHINWDPNGSPEPEEPEEPEEPTDPSNGMFAPEDELTRGMFFYALWNYCGSPVPYSTENPFTDISEADYYYDAVLWAVENGITNGMTVTQFGPDQSANRAQVATFLYRAFYDDSEIPADNPFTDVEEGMFYSEPALWACAEGYMGPLNGENTFCPMEVCLYGYIDWDATGSTLPDAPTEPEPPTPDSYPVLELETDLTVYQPGGDYTYVTFTPEADGTYVFYSVNSGDTVGRLCNTDMDELVYCDDCYSHSFHSNRDFCITHGLAAGQTYILGVRFYSQSSGDITIRVERSHSYVSEVTKEPTCTEDGVKTYTCTICGHSYTESIPASHSYEFEVTKEPTCTESGETTYTCVGCGNSYTTNEPRALGHQFESGVCSVCGAECKLELETDLTVCHPGGDYIYVTFTPEENGTYVFYSTTDWDTVGELFSADMETLSQNDDCHNGHNFHPGNSFCITYNLEAGQIYTLGVRFYSQSSGDITICVDQDEQINPEDSPVLELETDLNISCPSSDYTYVTFTPEADGTYVFYSVYCNDTIATLYTADMMVLSYCDDCNSGHNFHGGNDFCITYDLEAGQTYILGVRFYSQSSGDITIRVDRYGVEPEEPGDIESLDYTVYDDYVEIIGYIGNPYNIVIPATIEEKPVTVIASNAFLECTSLCNIYIPASVTTIGDGAFAECISLTTIRFAGNAPVADEEVFYDVTANAYYPFGNTTWTVEVMQSFGGSITWIADPGNGKFSPEDQLTRGMFFYALWNYLGSPEPVSTENPFTDIYQADYYYDAALWAVENRITNGISANQFGPDQSVNRAQVATFLWRAAGSPVPADVNPYTDVLMDSFYYHAVLWVSVIERYMYPATPTEFGVYEECYYGDIRWLTDNSFGEHDYFLYDTYSDHVVITGHKVYTEEMVIPAEIDGLPVTGIADGAFKNCSRMTGIEIPDSVTSIGAEAFSDCSSLTSVDIPDSVTSIGDSTFYGCTSLTSVDIPDSVTSIGDSTFYGCTSLTGIEIPDNVTSIGDRAFACCNSLTEVVIPDGVTSINYGTFYGCSSLTEIVIPGSVTSIGYNAFEDCNSLTEVIIPNGVTSIKDYTFYGCSSLTEIVIPDSVTSIDSWTFTYCSSLTKIVIPDGVTSIEDGTFYGCSSLTEIVIPDDVTFIGNVVFANCSDLTIIYFSGDAPEFGGNTFYGVTATAYCPADNDTWTEDVMQNYGGDITWIAHGPTHEYTPTVTAPTCTEQGFTTYNCVYGDFYVADYVEPLGHDYADHICIRCGQKDPNAPKPIDPSNGMYAPEDELTRSMIVYALWNYFGCPAYSSNLNPFVDIRESDYYYDAVMWAVEYGITSGYSPTQFSPDYSVNRAQAVTFLWRAFGSPESTGENPFSDVREGMFYSEAVFWACAEGYMGPLNDVTTFCPTAQCLYGHINWAPNSSTGHTHEYEAVVTAPTCTEDGYTTYTCTACGDSYIADETPAPGHKYEAVVTAPTCTEDGYTTYTCTVCGDSYIADVVAATGHTFLVTGDKRSCTCGEVFTGFHNDSLYINGGLQKAYQLVEFEGSYYFINDYHKIARNCKIYLSERFVSGTPLTVDYYEFDADGKLIIPENRNGVIDDYLYIDNVKQLAYQLVEFEGSYYFINDYHKIARNCKIYLSECFVSGTPFAAGTYEFDTDGKMIIPEVPEPRNGVIGDFLYINDVKQLAYQLVEFEGSYYFINDGHKIARSTKLYLSEQFVAGTPLAVDYYEFDADGKLIIPENKNGVIDDYLYIDNVKQLAYQLVEFEGSYYFINDYHKIARNCRLYLSERFVGGTPFAVGFYEFDADGHMIIG